MADTSHPEWVYIDDYLGKQALDFIDHEDGWPSMGLRFSPDANSTTYLKLLLEAAKNNSEKFDVYTHETMPERYHFSNNPRIAPVYIVPKYGYALTMRGRDESGMSKGVSPAGNHPPDLSDKTSSRTTDTITGTSACKQCLSPTGHSQMSRKLSTANPGCPTGTRAGTLPRTTFTLWIGSRTWRCIIS